MKRMSEAGYNERIFSGGIRSRLHLARFKWVHDALRRAGAGCTSVLELGCFDGRAIDYLPRSPAVYLGLDANWEGGLDAAKVNYAGEPRFRFAVCLSPDELRRECVGRGFDTAVSLETLEHVPPNALVDYVQAISEFTKGVLAVTVPNEKGPVFLGKYMVKRAFGDSQPYRMSELLAATMGRMAAVDRDEHKGFDYNIVIDAVARCFDVLEVSPYPMRRLPCWTGFGVGILARSKPG